jgi:hypothetical protein
LKPNTDLESISSHADIVSRLSRCLRDFFDMDAVAVERWSSDEGGKEGERERGRGDMFFRSEIYVKLGAKGASIDTKEMKSIVRNGQVLSNRC